MNETKSAPTPWHLWVIGVVTILWNAMGVLDFVMTQTHNEAYMSSFTPEQLEFFYGFPMWAVVFWAIAVFGGLIGSGLLLLRSKFAMPVFLISWIAMIVTAIQNYGISNAFEITGVAGAVFTVVIFVIAALLFWYSLTMKNRAVLT